MNILAHTSFIGTTGYNNHAQSFFTELNKLATVKVRNYTVGKSWKGYSLNCHDDEPYLTDVHKKMLHQQILHDGDDKRNDFPIYSYNPQFVPDKHIVLCETNHHIFYDQYSGYKIAYNVWETTLYPEQYFNKLLEFDELWVPTKWQSDCVIAQGYPAHKVKVVPEGVDGKVFHPVEQKSKSKFQFIIAGRWDYRKSTKELVQAFVNVFGDNDNVELLLLADNPYSIDGMNSTEERLTHFKLGRNNVKVIHFPSREDYVNMIQQADVFLSCARSEGWNLPLIEAMASGIPSIYSNWGGQLEFAEGKGIPVAIIDERPAAIAQDTFNIDAPGNYCEPDFKDLERQMLYAYENYSEVKSKALIESEEIRNVFSWSNVAKTAFDILYPKPIENEIAIVPAYIDTLEKEQLLVENIKQLRSFGYKICLTTHYPVKDYIQRLVDYYVYDSEDLVIRQKDFRKYDLHFRAWFESIDKSYKMFQSLPFNHSYAVWRLFKNATTFINSIKGYKKLHFIDYDNFIGDKEFLLNHSKMLDEKEAVFYHFHLIPEEPEHQAYFTVLFSMNIEAALRVFDQINSVEEYVHNKYGNYIIEHIIAYMFREFQIPHFVIPKEKVFEYGNRIDQSTMTSLIIQGLSDNDLMSYNVFKYTDEYDIFYIKELAHTSNYEIIINGKSISFNAVVDTPTLIQIKKQDEYKVKVYRNNVLESNTTLNLDEDHYFHHYIEISDDREILNLENMKPAPIVIVNHYVNGPFVEIKCKNNIDTEFLVSFINQDTNIVEYSTVIKVNQWTRANKQYFVNWKVVVQNLSTKEIIYQDSLKLSGRNVYIALDSKSLGDTLAWFPAVEAFRKKHNCNVICSTFWNKFFQYTYPHIKFVNPGAVVNDLRSMYVIGWFYTADGIDLNKNLREVKDQHLQKTAYDILGLDFVETKPKLQLPNVEKKKQVAIAIHSTCQSKYWNNPNGWQDVVNYCKDQGYEVVLVSKEHDGYMGNAHPTGITQLPEGPIEKVIECIEESQLFIGIGSGLSWLAWATTTPTVMISGFSEDYTESADVRIASPVGKCSGCFNKFKLDPGDWNWCPVNKGTDKQFECTKDISSDVVIEKIRYLL